MRTAECARCVSCGAAGRVLYSDLGDRLFRASGRWSYLQCERQSCGVLWVNPRPHEEDLHHAYVDYYTHRPETARRRTWPGRLHDLVRRAYLARTYGYVNGITPVAAAALGWIGRVNPARRAHWDFAVMKLPARPGGRLLDVGCGSGSFLRFARDLGWDVEGIDPDPSAVQAAKASGLKVRAGDLRQLAFQEESFDAVTMSHVIEHVPDPAALLREVRRVLKPGGLVTVVTPNARSLLHRWFRADWRGLEPPRHLQLFTRPALSRMIGETGFSVEHAATGVRDANNMYVASRRLRAGERHVHGDRGPLPLRARGHAASLVEWLASWRDPEAGEEITILGRR